jgi:TatA/E family protein of Tat protein translocase
MLLFLNDISGSEILVIIVFILIFFGPKSIPGIARSMGKTMRQIKDASNELQQEIKKSGVDIKKDMNLSGLINETVKEVEQPLDQAALDIENSIRFEPPRTPSIVAPVSIHPQSDILNNSNLSDGSTVESVKTDEEKGKDSRELT